MDRGERAASIDGPAARTAPFGKIGDLFPPPKTDKEARKRADWLHWDSTLKLEQASMLNITVQRRKDVSRGTRPITTKLLFVYNSTKTVILTGTSVD